LRRSAACTQPSATASSKASRHGSTIAIAPPAASPPAPQKQIAFCMHVAPGQHGWPLCPQPVDPDRLVALATRRQLLPLSDDRRRQRLPLPKGRRRAPSTAASDPRTTSTNVATGCADAHPSVRGSEAR
jgi:hypothetical protein